MTGTPCTGSYTGDFEVTLDKIYARERFPRSLDVTTTVETPLAKVLREARASDTYKKELAALDAESPSAYDCTSLPDCPICDGGGKGCGACDCTGKVGWPE